MTRKSQALRPSFVMKIFLAIATSGLLAVAGSAAEKPQQLPAKKPVPAGKVSEPQPSSQPTPAPKKRRFLGIPFGNMPTPSPAPSPSPTPATKPAPIPSGTAKPVTKKPTPATEPRSPESKPQAVAKDVSAETPQAAQQPTEDPKTDPVETEGKRYAQARAKALEDPQVRELQEKFDSAMDDEAEKEAGKKYYKALFEKIRQNDSSIKERADALEAKALESLAKKEL